MENYTITQHGKLRAKILPSHNNWHVRRIAYEEVLHGYPPNYDRIWRDYLPNPIKPENEATASFIYERTRQACLSLKLAGRLPRWRVNESVPEVIREAYRALQQEFRLGREANLVLDFSPPIMFPQELAGVY